MRTAFTFLFLLFGLVVSGQNSICFNRLHHGYAEILIPVNQWNNDSVTFKVYHPNSNLIVNPIVYTTASLPKVTSASGVEYYYLKGLASGYGNEALTYEVSSSLDAAVSNTLAPLPQDQWNTAGTSASCIEKAAVCFNRLHHGYAEILIPVNQWNNDSVTFKVYHPNSNLIVNPIVYTTASLPKVTAASGVEYYYLKGLASGYGNEVLTYEVSSSLDAAVSNTLAPLPQDQWNTAGTSASCIEKAAVCFTRLHHGYAEILIPVNQWNNDSVTFKVYHQNSNLIVNPIVYTTASLPKVTSASGVQYYYLKGLASGYGNEVLTYEVSSSLDAAVSNTLAPLPQDQWNTAGTSASCIEKAAVCFNRLHHGYAEILIPVNQWNNDSVTFKVYHPNSNLIVNPIVYTTASLPKVTAASGVEYYYLKGLASGYGNEALTYEVSSSLDAAVSNTLAPLPQDQWNTAGTSASCIEKAAVCFNRLHHGYAEILIPVNQWNNDSVTFKVYHPNSNLIVNPIVYTTASLPKVTSASGVEYYYLKGLASGYGNEALTYEVSSSLDAAVSNTLAPLPQDQWNTAGTSASCIEKAAVCFNRLHHGYAEILIPVNQWNNDSVTFKVYHPNSNLIVNPIVYTTASLPKVTAASGVEYYYLKGLASGYGNEVLTYEVSSSLDAAVSNTLAPLPQDQWNTAGTSASCIEKAAVCFTRLHHGYAEILIPVNQWNNDSVTFKVYHQNSNLIVNPIVYTTASLPKVTSASGVQYYYLKGLASGYGNEVLTYEVSSSLDAAVSNTLAPLPQDQWNDFTLQTTCINKAKGICINRSNANYSIYLQKNQWNDTTVRVKLYHSNGSLLYNQLFSGLSTTVYNGVLCYTVSASYSSYSNENIVAEVSSTKNAAFHMFLTPAQQLCYEADSVINPSDTLTADWTLAPNSYIFTGKDKNGMDADGLYIPVKKAYAMWADTSNPELSLRNPIAAGSLPSAYVYWEDISGLVKSGSDYKLELVGTGEDAKIKVLINKARGKGNAVVTFHAGANGNKTDSICWSWHVWVTDDVAINGSTYRQGFETDKNNVPFSQVTNRDGTPYSFQWMNRNLGATNVEFIGNDWNKSSGLMYQWGRKDPLPPLFYKDGTGYEINGAAGTFNGTQFTQNSNRPFGWTMRPYNNPGSHAEVARNIGYSVKNPLRAITFLSRYGHWFSDQPYKVASSDIYSIINWDLWSDNRKGRWSKVHTSNTAAAADTKSYELKSAYDPCPCGWRMPSHYGSIVAGEQSNLSSPWGRNGSWANDDPTDNSKFYLNTANPVLDKVKVYPSLGYDFTSQTDRNLGVFPLTGAYVFVGPNEVADYVSATPKLAYINWLATAGAGTATLSVYDSASGRGMGFVSDYYKYPTESKYRFSVSQIAPSKGAGTVRCMSDPNEKYLGNFETEFIATENSTAKTDNVDTLKRWSKDANSYIVMTNTDTVKRINLRKAYAMYKLYLSENNQLPQGQLSASVYWSTNAGLISNISLNNAAVIGNSEMIVSLNPGQRGNAVVAFHIGSSGTSSDPVIWSWHIWAPETKPAALAPYKTEEPYQPSPSSGQIIDPTNNCLTPPLVTEFMDRNMGALIAMPGVTGMDPVTGKKAIGLHYQWGRKDPIPTFLDQSTIMRNGSSINSGQYNTSFTRLFSVYGAGAVAGNDKRYIKTGRILKYAVENPLTYLYNDSTTQDWISNEPGLEAGRWGHATEKSPFDPCPDGWRVPDVSFAFLNQAYNEQVSSGVKGTSPWYLGKIPDPSRTDGIMGVDQKWEGTSTTITSSASTSYRGKLSTYTNGSGWAGYIFDDPLYAIGNYPVTGIRGETGVSVSNNFPRIAAWTAALGDGMSANAIALMLRYSKMQTGRGASPHQAMACRCAKIRYDENGKEIGRYDPNKIAVPDDAVLEPISAFSANKVNAMVKDNKITVFPNPVTGVIHLDVQDDKAYYYQIYNMAGQLVKEGKFNNKEADLSSLHAGAYLIRINNSESVVKIIKL